MTTTVARCCFPPSTIIIKYIIGLVKTILLDWGVSFSMPSLSFSLSPSFPFSFFPPLQRTNGKIDAPGPPLHEIEGQGQAWGCFMCLTTGNHFQTLRFVIIKHFVPQYICLASHLPTHVFMCNCDAYAYVYTHYAPVTSIGARY